MVARPAVWSSVKIPFIPLTPILTMSGLSVVSNLTKLLLSTSAHDLRCTLTILAASSLKGDHRTDPPSIGPPVQAENRPGNQPEPPQGSQENSTPCCVDFTHPVTVLPKLRHPIRGYWQLRRVLDSVTSPTPPLSFSPFQARDGGQETGQNYRRDLKLISEVQAPFRGVRLFAYAGLSAAAGIATLFTIPRVINAVKGGEGALPLLPELQVRMLALSHSSLRARIC
jgi:hypothetical protein